MDKIKHYQSVIIRFLHHYNQATGGNMPLQHPQRRVLIDKINNSFQLLAIGWRNEHYIFGPVFHFDILDGKIWMQCNNTEWEVVDFLMENGVERMDIVLGFVPAYARQASGFGVA
jgi:XisI protein